MQLWGAHALAPLAAQRRLGARYDSAESLTTDNRLENPEGRAPGWTSLGSRPFLGRGDISPAAGRAGDSARPFSPPRAEGG